MDILNSTWLINMLEKSSNTPHGRLLKLFDILEDWLEAPSILQQLSQHDLKPEALKPKKATLLQNYLIAEAAKAGAAMPDILGNQLYFMAASTIQARLQANIHAGSSDAFKHAKSAANALILAQTKHEFSFSRNTVFAVAASFVAICIVVGSLYSANLHQQTTQTVASNAPNTAQQVPIQSVIPQLVAADTLADPLQTAALMAQIEQMRHGNCQLIEAIQLPDSQKGIYLNMVVNGQVSTDAKEQAIALELLQKTRCNYTPKLMANSTG